MGKTKQILKWLGKKYMEMGQPGKDGKPTKTQKYITLAGLPARIANEYVFSQSEERQNEIFDNIRDKLGINTNSKNNTKSTTKSASIPGYTKQAFEHYGNTKLNRKF